MKSKEKQKFISDYMTRNMKKYQHLPYGIEWHNRKAETEDKAELAWKIRSSFKPLTKEEVETRRPKDAYKYIL